MKRTPIPAIRANCRECNGNTGWAAVRDCAIHECSLQEYRLGSRPKGKAKLTPGKAIDEYCLYCMGARVVNGKSIGRSVAAQRARECHLTKCELWHIRYGENKRMLTGKGQLRGFHDAETSETIKDTPAHPERLKAPLFEGV